MGTSSGDTEETATSDQDSVVEMDNATSVLHKVLYFIYFLALSQDDLH